MEFLIKIKDTESLINMRYVQEVRLAKDCVFFFTQRGTFSEQYATTEEAKARVIEVCNETYVK